MPGRFAGGQEEVRAGVLKYAIVVEHENDLQDLRARQPLWSRPHVELRSRLIPKPTIFNTAHPNCLPQ